MAQLWKADPADKSPSQGPKKKKKKVNAASAYTDKARAIGEKKQKAKDARKKAAARAKAMAKKVKHA